MPRVKQFDEEEVLQKAVLIFWRKGYYNTSIQDLVDFLGVNRASLYNTFGGKKKLFDKAFEQYRKVNHEGFTNFLNTQENVKDALRMVFTKIINDDCSDKDRKGCLIANTTTELLPTDKKLQKLITQHKLNTEKAFFDLLSRGVKKGQISKDTDLETISRLLYTLMTGLRVVSKTKPTFEESMTSVEAVLELLD